MNITLKPILTCLLVILSLVFPNSAFSQKKGVIIRGRVTDRNKKPIQYAIAGLISSKDSVNLLTDDQGNFQFRNLADGDYVIKVSFIGFKPWKKAVKVSQEKLSVNLGDIILDEGLNLKEIAVNAQAIAIIVKDDTIEYNAGSFKTPPNATVEDLLKKLPGIDVDNDGNLKAEGENIQKVLVDGKEFFGNDPKIATKNLPADAIKKAQLINDKSEAAKASGIDDGKRKKVLNLVLKEDKKNGSFGNASIMGGTKSRYLGSASWNYFRKQRQLNFLLLSNNVNQSGFSAGEIRNFTGSRSNSYSYFNGSRTMNGVNLDNGTSGLNSTTAGGVNYSDNWGKKKKTEISVSYFASTSTTEKETDSKIQSFQPNSVLYKNISNWSNTNTKAHRINIRFKASPDSLTTVSLEPAVSFNTSRAQVNANSAQNNNDMEKLNSSDSKGNSHSFSPNINGNYSIYRRFRNQKGRVSLFIYNYLSNSDYNNWQQNSNYYYQTNESQDYNREDQHSYESNSLTATGTVNRTVSSDKKSLVYFSANYSIRNNNSGLDSYEYNPNTGLYEIQVDSLYNDSKSKVYEMGPELGFNRSTKKWNVYAHGSINSILLRGSINSSNSLQQVSKDYLVFEPSASLRYSPRKEKSYQLNSRLSTSTPPIQYLQLDQNNTNPMNISYGNPDLKVSRTLSNNFIYKISNVKKNTFTTINLNSNYMLSSVVTNTTYDTLTGIRYSKPVNVQGGYSLSLNGTTVIPTQIKTLRLNTGMRISSQRNKGFLNDKPNNSDRILLAPSFNGSYGYKELFDIHTRNTISRSWITNSASVANSRNYFTFSNDISVNIYPSKMWRINTHLIQQSYAGQNNALLLNASIERYFMSKKQLTIELKGFDLLNHNPEVERFFSDDFIMDRRSNNLNRYFYLKLLYKVNKTSIKH